MQRKITNHGAFLLLHEFAISRIKHSVERISHEKTIVAENDKMFLMLYPKLTMFIV